jgi:hypothetical protein
LTDGSSAAFIGAAAIAAIGALLAALVVRVPKRAVAVASAMAAIRVKGHYLEAQFSAPSSTP